MSGPMVMTPKSLRDLAHLLDGLAALEVGTGWTVCAYGPVSVAPVDGSTTAISVNRVVADDGTASYVVDDRNGS